MISEGKGCKKNVIMIARPKIRKSSQSFVSGKGYREKTVFASCQPARENMLQDHEECFEACSRFV